MTEFPSSKQVNTFVVRIWHDRSASGRSWYGRIENIHTGQHIAFQEWDRLAEFIRGDCAIEEDKSQEAHQEVNHDDP